LIKIEDIVDLVKVHLGVKRINKESHIIQDLGAESADIVNIVASLEDKYRIKIKEEEIGDIQTVGDLFALVQQKL
jgi:acyl carrier protein